MWIALANGQELQLFPDAIVSGGGVSGSVDFTLSGSIGQPVTGASASPEFAVQSGLWGVMLYLVLPPPGESFERWMAGLAEQDLPPEGLRGPMDQPAGDGMPNILKYALGLLPMQVTRDGYPDLAVASRGGQDYLAITLVRAAGANVVLQLQGCDNLEDWQDIPFTLEVLEALEDGRERIRLVSTITAPPADKYFLRLDVGLPPE